MNPVTEQWVPGVGSNVSKNGTITSSAGTAIGLLPTTAGDVAEIGTLTTTTGAGMFVGADDGGANPSAIDVSATKIHLVNGNLTIAAASTLRTSGEDSVIKGGTTLEVVGKYYNTGRLTVDGTGAISAGSATSYIENTGIIDFSAATSRFGGNNNGVINNAATLGDFATNNSGIIVNTLLQHNLTNTSGAGRQQFTDALVAGGSNDDYNIGNVLLVGGALSGAGTGVTAFTVSGFFNNPASDQGKDALAGNVYLGIASGPDAATYTFDDDGSGVARGVDARGADLRVASIVNTQTTNAAVLSGRNVYIEQAGLTLNGAITAYGGVAGTAFANADDDGILTILANADRTTLGGVVNASVLDAKGSTTLSANSDVTDVGTFSTEGNAEIEFGLLNAPGRDQILAQITADPAAVAAEDSWINLSEDTRLMVELEAARQVAALDKDQDVFDEASLAGMSIGGKNDLDTISAFLANQNMLSLYEKGGFYIDEDKIKYWHDVASNPTDYLYDVLDDQGILRRMREHHRRLRRLQE